MSVLPGFLLTETVTIEPYTGITPAGPGFGPAVAVRAQVQETTELAERRATAVTTSNSQTAAITSRTWQIWIRPGPTVPNGSRVTVRGQPATAAQVAVNTAPGLPGWRHLEIQARYTTFVASTTITILRGTPTTDSFGDLVDTATVVASGVRAALVEDSQTSSEPVEQRGGIVETFTARMPSTTDVREGDRLRDDRTARVYRVLDVAFPNAAFGPEMGTDDVIATCRRVSATSTPNT